MDKYTSFIKILLAVSFFLSAVCVSSAAEATPGVEWAEAFGGADDEIAFSVQQTQDGGYILTGHTSSYGAGGEDVYLIKTDPKGNEVWSRTFGGSDDDSASSVQQTQDGGYILAGYTSSYGTGGEDVYLIKTDPKGNEVWSRTFGGSDDDSASSVQQTQDGGYILAGYTKSYSVRLDDVWLIKTDSQGNEQWSRTFGGNNFDGAHSVQQTNDSGYILSGYTNSLGIDPLIGDNAWLIKTDSQGNEQWNRTFGGSSNFYAYYAFSVQQTSDDGYIIAGSAGNPSPFGSNIYYDVWLIKTDSQGRELWSKTFESPCSSDGSYSVQQTIDGGYILAGMTCSSVAGGDAWIIKTDSQGNEEWSKTLGGSSFDLAYSVQQAIDGGYIVAGMTYSYGDGGTDAWIIKIAPITNHILDFSSGYNPWALPLYLPNDLRSQELIAEVPYVKRVLTWDTNLYRWLYTTRIGNNILGEDFPIETSRGYFILAEQDTSYTFRGWQITEPIMPELSQGYNLVRIYDPQETYTSHMILKKNAQIQKIFSFDTKTGKLVYAMKGFFDTVTGPDFNIAPNKSYIVLSD